MQLGCSARGSGSRLDRSDKSAKAVEVFLVLGLNYLAENDDKGDERSEKKCPASVNIPN